MPQPDVSVVVIVYNDAERLPVAVRSALDQTLRNLEVIICDDASTDSTPEVAQQLAAEDPRVRYVRLPQNSGGCSAPRNAGIEAATGTFVMFLDSDDEFDRHACKNLVVAAESAAVDVAAGRVERVHVDQGGTRRQWFHHLYQEPAVVDGIRALPDLFFDSVVVNKIYRRSFLDEHGIRFPEGVLYEDLLFTARVYCSAERIALIPELVYRWKVYGKGTSITNRRHELENFVNRVRVHRLIDAYLLDSGNADLKPAKDLKFLKHDLRLYLNDLMFVADDESYVTEFFRLAAEYLSTIDPAAVAQCSQIERIAYYLVQQGDRDGVSHAMDFLARKGKLSVQLVERDGRVYWSEHYLDDPEARRLLDVTDLRLHKIPFPQMHVYNELTGVTLRKDRLELEGSIINQLGRFVESDPLTGYLSVRRLRRTGQVKVPVTLQHGPERIVWRASMPIDDLPLGFARTQNINLVLHTEWEGHANETSVSLRPEILRNLPEIPVKPRGRLIVGSVLTPTISSGGFALYKLVNRNAAGRTIAAAAARPGLRRAATRLRAARASVKGPRAKRLVYRLASLQPIDARLVVFESMLGKQYSDSPRAVFEALQRADLGFQPVWVRAPGVRAGQFPKGIPTVERESLRYYALLARARAWVDNQGFPRLATKRSGTTYVQTWHGTPLKLMGFDEPAIKRMGPDGQAAFQRMVDRWDHLVVPNEYFEQVFVPAHRYRGDLLRVGYPRNDVLLQAEPDDVAAIRDRLGLPADRKIALYAPTFRQRGPMRLALELGLAEPRLSDSWFLLIRPHYLNRVTIPPQFAHFARDVSSIPDISELYLAADVLITDYSSTMFDYANLARPMVFFAYDYEEYTRAARGTYLELKDVAPGPIVRTTHEVADVLLDLDAVAAAHSERLEVFRKRFCSYETGHAAEDVVDRVFRPIAPGRSEA